MEKSVGRLLRASEVRALKNYGFSVSARAMFSRRCGFAIGSVGSSTSKRRRHETLARFPPRSACRCRRRGAVRPGFAHALASMRVYSIEPHKLREMQDTDKRAQAQPDGSNVTSVLQGDRAPIDRDSSESSTSCDESFRTRSKWRSRSTGEPLTRVHAGMGKEERA